MVLGNSMSVLLKLEVDLSELSKLQQARAMVNAFSNDAASSFDRASVGMRGAGRAAAAASDKFGMAGRRALVTGLSMEELSAASILAGESVDEAGDKGSRSMLKLSAVTSAVTKKIQGLTVSTQALRVAFLNMMFAGMNAVFLFGAILALSPRVRIGLISIVNALRPIAMVAGQMLGPALQKLAQDIRNLSDKQERLIAKIAIVGTALGAVATVTGVLGGILLTLGKVVALVTPSLGTMSTVLGILRSGAILALQGIRALSAAMLARLLPAIGSVAAALGVSATALTGGLIVAIGLAIAAFIEFESIRKATAGGLTKFGQTVMNTLDVIAFFSETSVNGFRKFGAVSMREFIKFNKAITEFVIDSAEAGVKAINDLIEVINQIPDPKGLIPNLEKIEFDTGLGGSVENMESQITSLNQKIAEIEGQSQKSFRKLRRNLEQNKKGAKKTRKALNGLFQTGKDTSILPFLNMLNPLDPLRQKSATAGQTSGRTVSESRNMATEQTINNEVVIRDATINDDRDIDELMREIEERMERNQRRDKTLI